MRRDPPGVASFERLEAILANPAIYRLGALIPRPDACKGGRPRAYPDFMVLVYEALLSVYRSARQVEAELSHPVVWRFICRKVKKRFPRDTTKHLPRVPMKRHHYTYLRNRYLADPAVLAELTAQHRSIAADQARQIGLMQPDGPGTWTHPHLSRMMYADGKVVTPLFKAKPGDARVDKQTGEVRPLRCEPDAGLHYEGTGEMAFGTKFVIVAARTEDSGERIILDSEWVPDAGGEAAVAMKCFGRLAPLVPGAQGVLYDTALRGVHHQELLRDFGLVPINKVSAASSGKAGKGPRRRTEKSVHIEDKRIELEDGSSTTVHLYARGGAVGIGELTETGDLEFVELKRVRTRRTQDLNGKFRWYNYYALPGSQKTVVVRLHGNDEDRRRRLNRTENVRPVAPTDPDFKKLHKRRNDAESINRGIVDSLYLGRAHSVGHSRQTINLLGYALVVNGLALHRYRRRLAAAAAA